MNKVNIEEKLNFNKYNVDEQNAHIILKENFDMTEYAKLIQVCPAGLYKLDENNVPRFDYAGCLECGACRILCGQTIIAKWEFPGSTMGVEYRNG
jgi:ferredoxin-like protein FixX